MRRTRPLPRVLRRTAAPIAVALTTVLVACSGASGSVSQTSAEPSADSDEALSDPVGADATDEAGASAAGVDADPSTAGNTNSSAGEDTAPSADAEGSLDLDLGSVGTLSTDTMHEISLSFDDADYDAMIDAYSSSGDKEWIEATVTIDGATYENAGIRLKGNSSLRGTAGGGGGPMSSASADDPTSLPWLIKLDKFVDGQNHGGLTDLVVRSNSSATALNEAVALELLGLAGLATQDAIATSFSVNGSDPALRLVIDNPDDQWMAEELDESGALYKAESSGDYSYRGDDPESYTDVFDQEAGKDNTDLTPLIAFLDFVNNTDDATFEAELADHLDVDAFATYLAMQDLLDNFDDIDGPGNNSYLYYDSATGQFTVVPWDYNLAFGQGPGGGGGFGGGGFGGQAPGADEGVATNAAATARPAPPGGGGFGGPPGGGGNLGVGPGGRENVLVERFLAVDAWQSLYEQRVEELRTELFDSGLAGDVLTEWIGIVSSSGLVDDATVTSESAQISQQLS